VANLACDLGDRRGWRAERPTKKAPLGAGLRIRGFQIALIGAAEHELTLADYIREDERIEAIRRLKLSRPTNEAKRLFVADNRRKASWLLSLRTKFLERESWRIRRRMPQSCCKRKTECHAKSSPHQK